MGWGNKSLFKWSWSHDQDGCHAHIWQKTSKIFFRTEWLRSLKHGIQHRTLKYYQVCSNDDPRLTFDLFMQRSNLVPYAFIWETVYKVKVDMNCKLNEYLKICMCLRSRSFFDLGPRSLRFCRHQHFQTSSSQKPLGQSVKFCIDSPWDGGRKFHSNYCGHMTKMSAMLIYGKNFEKSSSLEHIGRCCWNLVYSIGHSCTTKFVQMMTIGWPLTFFVKVIFGSLCICIGNA